MVFDVQDVGARFYTYISSMHYVMEACAEQDRFFMVLDRPNPNGTLSSTYLFWRRSTSLLWGCTPGAGGARDDGAEYAEMINGEGWLAGGARNASGCALPVIPRYALRAAGGSQPNPPNMRSIYLYPSLCFLRDQYQRRAGTSHQF